MRKFRILHLFFSLLLVSGLNAQMEYQDFVYDGLGSGAMLQQASAVTVSPDGKNLYVMSAVDHALTVYARDLGTGNLSFIELHRNGINRVEGISNSQSIIVSGDGNFVYVAGAQDDAIALFSRNSANGTLSFVTSYDIEDNGISGLTGVNKVVLSPDGKNLYGLGSGEDAIAVFTRDEVNGTLTPLEVIKDGNDVTDMANPLSAVLSTDGQFMYVTAYDSDAVLVFSRDITSGSLTFVEKLIDGVDGVTGIYGAFSLAISPDDTYVYVTGPEDFSLAVFTRDAVDGKLTFMEKHVSDGSNETGLEYAVDITVSSDGQFIYLVDQDESGVTVFKRNDVDPNVALDFVDGYKNGFDGVDGIDYAQSLVLSPEGGYVYVTGRNDNAIAIFQRDNIAGTLSYVMKEESGVTGLAGLKGVFSSFISQDGKFLYAAGSADNAITAFSRNVETGELTPIDNYFNNVDGISGLAGVRQIAASPDERYLYAAGWGDDAIVVFLRDEVTGALTYHSTYTNAVDGVMGLDGANTIAVSPDGNHVYISSTWTNSVAVFMQNQKTDSLEYVDAKFDGQDNTIDGIKRASGVVVSDDGQYVYVTGSEDDAIAIFSRDQISGELTYQSIIKDNINGVDGLDGVQSISKGPNGNYYYVTGFAENAIALFSKGTDGMLDFVEAIKDGENGVSGLAGVRLGAINPDGKHFYACGSSANSVAVFFLDPSSGKLNYVTSKVDGVDDNNGLGAVYSVSVSPDGFYIYTAGTADDAIGIYRNLYRVNLDQTICTGESYSVGGNTYTETGVYVDTSSAEVGARTITNLDLFVVNVDADGSLGFDSQQDTGRIVLQVSGGVEPYTYVWSDQSTEKNLSGVAAGSYSVTVTDATGCSNDFSFELSESTGTENVEVTSFTAQLRPNRIVKGTQAILNINNTQTQRVTIELFDQLGRSLRTNKETLNIGQNRIDFEAPHTAGIYFVKLITRKGKVKTLKLVVE